jgi:hypothetical protein
LADFVADPNQTAKPMTAAFGPQQNTSQPMYNPSELKAQQHYVNTEARKDKEATTRANKTGMNDDLRWASRLQEAEKRLADLNGEKGMLYKSTNAKAWQAQVDAAEGDIQYYRSQTGQSSQDGIAPGAAAAAFGDPGSSTPGEFDGLPRLAD